MSNKKIIRISIEANFCYFFCLVLWVVRVLFVRQYEKTFWGNRNVLYLECGGVYLWVFTCQSSSKCTLEMSAIILCKLWHWLKKKKNWSEGTNPGSLRLKFRTSISPSYTIFFSLIFHMLHIQNNPPIQIGL